MCGHQDCLNLINMISWPASNKNSYFLASQNGEILLTTGMVEVDIIC
jgi:hypothetical protein